jgi:hypothetical protein
LSTLIFYFGGQGQEEIDLTSCMAWLCTFILHAIKWWEWLTPNSLSFIHIMKTVIQIPLEFWELKLETENRKHHLNYDWSSPFSIHHRPHSYSTFEIPQSSFRRIKSKGRSVVQKLIGTQTKIKRALIANTNLSECHLLLCSSSTE